MIQSSWKVHKFGGSSLADAACFRNVAEILLAQPDARIGVVVSAIRGMTDQLLALVESAENGVDPADVLNELGDRYLGIATELLAADRLARVREEWGKDREALGILLGGARNGESVSGEVRDTIAGYGEIWSARLLATFLAQQGGEQRAGRWLDARDVLRVRQAEVGALVQ